MAAMMGGGGGRIAKAERKEKRLDAKGDKLAKKEDKRLSKNLSNYEQLKGNAVYQEKMALIDKGIKPKGKMTSKVEYKAKDKLQKLATKESKKVSKMGQDAYWADNSYGSTTSRAKTYAAKVNKVESKAKEKVNKIIQKRAK